MDEFLFGETRQEEMLRAFIRFHEDNPRIWELFQKYSFQLIDAGRENYSARTVFHRIRWHVAIRTTDPDLKINDHHSPFYARLFHLKHPVRDGFFRLRKLKSAERMATGSNGVHIDGPPEDEGWLNSQLGRLI